MAHDTICSGSKLTALADAIRERAGTDSPLTLDAMADAVAGIPAGSGGAEVAASIFGRTYTEVPFADAITAVGSYAFYSNRDLVGEVRLPHATSIGYYAFHQCSKVTAIVAPVCVTVDNLGDLDKLTRLELPAATRIDGLFAKALRELRLPSCTRFGAYFGSSSAAIERVSLPAAVTFASDYTSVSTFIGARSLRSLSLDSAPKIGGHYSSSYLVDNCAVLESLHLPALTELRKNALKRCASLTSLWLPSCTSIHSQAIGEGVPLDTLVLPGATVCALGGSLNAGTAIAQGTGHVYVPSALLADYEQAANWSAYASQLRAIEDWPDEVATARATAEAAAQGWDDPPAGGGGE